MLKLTLELMPTILLVCGASSSLLAQGNTPITVKDGGSILLRARGLDAGTDWSVTPAEIRHLVANGVLGSVRITDAGADLCNGDPKCGIDVTQPWAVQIVYGAGTVTIGSVSANQGVHIINDGIPFDQWVTGPRTDERIFGHGDGLHITGITVNKGATVCSGNGACEVTLIYTTP